MAFEEYGRLACFREESANDNALHPSFAGDMRPEQAERVRMFRPRQECDFANGLIWGDGLV